MITDDTDKLRRYFEFLDRRIPELHAMGKPAQSSGDPMKISANLRGSKFPGAMARVQADAEWGEMQG